jgi:hypothetical protein
MVNDFFEQLAETEIPPPPAGFDRQLHQRVNRSLLMVQLMDLVFGALPWAVGHMARAFIGLVTLTITGKFETNPNKNSDPKKM